MQVSPNNIVILISAITIIFLIAGTFMVLYVTIYNGRKKKYLDEKNRMEETFEQELTKTKIEVQEDTYSALAKELHDNIGQLLSSTKMLLGITQRKLDKSCDTLVTADETLGKAIQELRLISKSLNKDYLEQFSLVENLQSEINRINSTGCLQATFVHPDNLSIGANEQLILFRIVQEAIQNAIKHADANNITITITEKEEQLITTIADDGIGFSENTVSFGTGVVNMKHRVKLLVGFIQWENPENNGTVVRILLPVKSY